MTKLWKNISKYLPIIVGIIVLCSATNASAGIGDWLVDKAGLLAAKALGIDTADNCVPPQSHTSCLFCPMFKILYNAGNAVAAKAYRAFHSDLGKLVCLFLCVSLALIILKNIASMSTQDPGTLVNDILNKVFIGIAIFIIVTQDYHNILNLTLVPIFTSGMEFVSVGASGDLQNCGAAAGIAGFSGSIGSNSDAGIPTSIGKTLICTADYIESKIDTLFEYGRWGFCRGMGPDRLYHVIPSPIHLIDALLLYLGGIFFTVAYPWVLGDAVLQLGISMALLPFAIAGYAFKGTKKYLSTVFGWILNTLFVFMFMVILITCILVYIQNIILEAASASGDPKVLFTDPVRGIAFFGANMFMMLFVLIIGYTYMPQVDELAGQFSKGSALSAAKAFGTFLTDQMDKQAAKVGDKAAAIAGDAAMTAGRVTTRRMRAGVRQGAMLMTNTFGKDDGSGNKRLTIPGVMSFTTMKNADGSTYLKREFTNPLNGRKHVMVSDKYSTIRQEYDRNGNLIKSDVSFKHSFAKNYLLNKDGTLNVEAYKVLLDSNLARDPEFKKAIMAHVATTVLKAKGKDIGKYYESRNVIIDPNNPNRIVVEQIDNTGKKTSFSMDVNMATGQVAVGYTRSRGNNRFESSSKFEQLEVFFDNGAMTINSTAARDPITGAILKETTKTTYSAAVQAGHDSIIGHDEGAQVVDSNGNISSRLDLSDPRQNILFGLDNMVDLSPSIQRAVQNKVANEITDISSCSTASIPAMSATWDAQARASADNWARENHELADMSNPSYAAIYNTRYTGLQDKYIQKATLHESWISAATAAADAYAASIGMVPPDPHDPGYQSVYNMTYQNKVDAYKQTQEQQLMQRYKNAFAGNVKDNLLAENRRQRSNRIKTNFIGRFF